MKSFADRFGSLRNKGETQKEFADRLGVTQASISRYLRGQHPDRESINKICKGATVTVDWLLTGKESDMSKELDEIVSHIDSSKTKPKDDNDWVEILLSYFDRMESLPKDQKETLKHITRAFVNDPDFRIDLIDYWNYLRFREKNPTMSVPKRKRRVRG